MPNYYKSYKTNKSPLVHQKTISVNNYNRCRGIPLRVIDYFINTILSYKPRSILDAGVGSGRFFIPLVKRVHKTTNLTGVDISQPMLTDLQTNIKFHPNINLYQADLRDAQAMKKVGNKFDVIFTFATLHIISERWKKALDILINLLDQKGIIILGEEINSVFHASENIFEDDDFRLFDLNKSFKNKTVHANNHKILDFFRLYHRLREEYGVPYKRVNGQILHGDQSAAERYLRSKGFCQSTISSPKMVWLKQHTFADIIFAIRNGTVTTLGSDMPDNIRRSIADKLEQDCLEKGYNLSAKMPVSSKIEVHIFRK